MSETVLIDESWLEENDWPESIEFELPDGEKQTYRRES